MSDCSLCQLPTPDPPVVDDGVDGEFCCRGCLEVARTLGTLDAEEALAELEPESADEDALEDAAEVYLAVDGMHCATCEAFVEAVATREEGVLAAEASYAADLVKLSYDPELRSEDDLPAVIDGLGYRARRLDEPADDDQSGSGRLLVGLLFGMMVMLWYVLFLYPAYLGVSADRLLLDVSGSAGRYLLGNVWVMTSIVLFYTGFPVLRGAYVSLRAGVANMDLLVSLAAVNAYVYSTVAWLVGHAEVYFDIAVVVVLAVTVGTHCEERIKRRATGLLADLTADREGRAMRLDGGEPVEVAVEKLEAGDRVLVKPGERVPVDGTVREGRAAVDESVLTGESLPVPKERGDRAIGGSLVTDDALVIEVADDATSTLDRLVALLWEVQSGRSSVQRTADRLAAVFVPLVVALAVVAAGWHLYAGATPTDALLTGLTVLVVSCPCALGLATPLAVAAGVREGLQRGIVITDASAFERASAVDVVAFDKTGTLTTGDLELLAGGGEPLRRAAAVEQFADHPVADAIVDASSPTDATVANFERHPGRGASADIDGERVLVGSPDLFEEEGWSIPDAVDEQIERAYEDGNLPVVVGWAGRARDVLVAGDQPREEWESVVADLDAAGVSVVVITGDSEAAARRFREHPAIEEVFAGVPPKAKAEVVCRLRDRGTVAMVGDGVNDAPALAAADVGIAFGDAAALATDAAATVVTTDDLRAVPTDFALTRATRRRVRENLGWAFCYNAIAIPVAAVGLLNPLLAAVAMAASSLLVVGNSTRALLDSRST